MFAIISSIGHYRWDAVCLAYGNKLCTNLLCSSEVALVKEMPEESKLMEMCMAVRAAKLQYHPDWMVSLSVKILKASALPINCIETRALISHRLLRSIHKSKWTLDA